MKVVIRLLPFVKKYWLGLLLAFICLSISTAAGLIVPMQIGKGIDSVLHSGAQSTVIIAGIVIVASSALRGMADYGRQYLSQVVSQQASYDMRNKLYDHIQKLSFAYHDKAQTGQLMSRATSDVEAVRMFLSDGLLGFITIVLLILGVAYFLLTIDWRLALLTLLFVPPIVWLTINVSRRLRPVWLRVQQLMGTLGITLQESLMGIRVVKAFSRQDEEKRKFAIDAKQLYEKQVDAARLTAFNMPLMVFLLSLPTAIILWYGGRQVIAGSLSIGGIAQFILYLGMLGMPVRRLGFITNSFSRTASAGQRILEILDSETEVKEKAGAIELGRLKGEVAFDNVSFGYNNISPALKDVSFNVKPGQLVALLGGSGSGKTTLAHLISRFYDVTGGRVLVDGNDVRDVTLASLRRNVGVAQQDVFLFSTTIKNNIAYGASEATMEQIVEAARAAQIHDFIESLPDKYETWVGERGLTLSGGEKQRIVIARAILKDPAILILDDSTSSVDAKTEHLIRLALDKLIEGRTTFVITHRLPIIKNAGLILMLKDGQIVERGQHEELLAMNGLYKQTYLSQLAASEELEVNQTEG
ncbi:MAG TPA: ABC transporter ATP-binding protein [Dehalococcoidales bacterium]